MHVGKSSAVAKEHDGGSSPDLLCAVPQYAQENKKARRTGCDGP